MVPPDAVHLTGFLILLCFEGQTRWAVFKSSLEYAWTLATVTASPSTSPASPAGTLVTSITPQRIPSWGTSLLAAARSTSVIFPGTETAISFAQFNARNNLIKYDALKQRAPFHATWTVLTDPRTGMAVVSNIAISRNPDAATNWVSFEKYIETTKIKTKTSQQPNPTVALDVSIPDPWVREPALKILEAPDTFVALFDAYGSLEGRLVDWGRRYPFQPTVQKMGAADDLHLHHHQLASGPATDLRHQLAGGSASVTDPLLIAPSSKKVKIGAGGSSSAPQFAGYFASLQSGLAAASPVSMSSPGGGTSVFEIDDAAPNWSTPSDAMAAELVAAKSELAATRASHASEMAAGDVITKGLQRILDYVTESQTESQKRISEQNIAILDIHSELAAEKIVNADLHATNARLEKQLSDADAPLNLELFDGTNLDDIPLPPPDFLPSDFPPPVL